MSNVKSIVSSASEKFLSVTRSVVALAILLKVKPADFAKVFSDEDGQEEYLLEGLATFTKLEVEKAKKQKEESEE